MIDAATDLKRYLPTSVKEMKLLGWESIDVVIFSGDAYVDHPSFGAVVIARTLLAAGYKVALVPQPNWRDDLRDFRKFGAPRLFFGVSAGAMDSMVNHYTAARRRRSDDAYTPGGKAGMRPDYPTIVYSNILRDLFPDTPIVAGAIEASLRRVSHYDYWQDTLKPSIIVDCKADMLMYGMGERAILELAKRLDCGENIADITDLRQTVVRRPLSEIPLQTDDSNVVLANWRTVKADKRAQSTNFKYVEQESNRRNGGRTLWQGYDDFAVKINPMYPAMSTGEIDASFDLPYTRMPHPRYAGKRIPAYDMIRHSVNMHRGCFGGCAFCTISAHQGKFIASRSKESILREVEQVTKMPDFAGYISDLGGPSANMYGMGGKNKSVCDKCLRPSCLHPVVCPNLDTDHSALLDVYHAADSVKGVKKSFVGSGVRYDLSLHSTGDKKVDAVNRRYNEELIEKHVSGRLKVAPEHTEDAVLDIMRKPSFDLFYKFKKIFDSVNARTGMRQQLIPYFISSHPGCTEEHMAVLAARTKDLNMHLEQVQDFTPTPMTVATEIYYSGYHPYTGQKVYTAVRPEEKLEQRKYFFWYDHAYRDDIIRSLTRIHRPDLIAKLYPGRPFMRSVMAVTSHNTSRNKSINTTKKYEHKQSPNHDSNRNVNGGNKRRRR